MSVWNLSNGVSFTDSSTTDLSSTTSNFVWRVTNTSNVISLLSIITGSSTFDTKVSVRIIS